MSLRGYCRTFSPPSPDRFGKSMGRSAFVPAMRITKLTTIARTGRLMKRSVNDFMSIFQSRVNRSWIHLRLRREIVVDCHGHPVAQLENARAHDRFARLQPSRNRNEIAARFAHTHKLL